MSLIEAEGFADLGMWGDCWNVIARSPAEVRLMPEDARLRLRCCMGLEAWGRGEMLAHELKDGTDQDRQLVATFWLSWARAEPEFAKTCITAAINTWPDCRLEILDDPMLSGVLG